MIRHGVNPSESERKQDGVCFPNEAGRLRQVRLRQVIEHALQPAA